MKAINKVAKELSISEDTVSLILKNNNVKIRDPRSVYVRIIELDLLFDDMTKCCLHLIENKRFQHIY